LGTIKEGGFHMALQQLAHAITFGSVLTLFSLGLSLTWGTLDVLNLAHGSLFVFAGFLAFEITLHVHMAFILPVVCCMIATGIVAMLLELVAVRHIRLRLASKRQAELSMLLASIGASGVIDTIVSTKTGLASSFRSAVPASDGAFAQPGGQWDGAENRSLRRQVTPLVRGTHRRSTVAAVPRPRDAYICSPFT